MTDEKVKILWKKNYIEKKKSLPQKCETKNFRYLSKKSEKIQEKKR